MNDAAAYDAFWARFFGIEPAYFARAGVTIVPHAQLGDYNGVWFFTRRAAVVVSAPAHWVDRLRLHRGNIAAQPLPSRALLEELLGRAPARVIGPAYQGYLAPGAFRPSRDAQVRRLSAADESALLAMQSACTEEEWDHSALSITAQPLFGYVRDGLLIAAAGSDHWTDDALSPGVLSRRDVRGQGAGTAVVSAVVEEAFGAGKLPLFQTLFSNAASVALAERLGYRHYGTHLAVRL